MKILVIADVHANLEALESVLEEDFDKIIFLGDGIDYGPTPVETLDLLIEKSFIYLMGNHDNANAYHTDCRCSEKMHTISVHSRQLHTIKMLEEKHLEFLRNQSPMKYFVLDGINFLAVHATIRNPLYNYIYPCDADENFQKELSESPHYLYMNYGEKNNPDIILLGHTHIPFIRNYKGKIVLNPGSVGQPRDGIWLTSYAIINDGNLILKRKKYSVEKTIEKTKKLPLPDEDKEKLQFILKNGRL